MEDWATFSDKYLAQHRGETKDDLALHVKPDVIRSFGRLIPLVQTSALRDLLGTLASELRLRGHGDAGNYLTKAVACLGE